MQIHNIIHSAFLNRFPAENLKTKVFPKMLQLTKYPFVSIKYTRTTRCALLDVIGRCVANLYSLQWLDLSFTAHQVSIYSQ